MRPLKSPKLVFESQKENWKAVSLGLPLDPPPKGESQKENWKLKISMTFAKLIGPANLKKRIESPLPVLEYQGEGGIWISKRELKV